MSLAKLEENHPRFGLTYSEETKVLKSIAKTGIIILCLIKHIV